jgi:hypothetical protein
MMAAKKTTANSKSSGGGGIFAGLFDASNVLKDRELPQSGEF